MVLLTAVNPMNEEHKDPCEIDWKHIVLHGTSRKSSGKDKTRLIGSIYNLLNVGRDLRRPSPTQANLSLGPILLRPIPLGPVPLRPSPTWADLFFY